MTTKTYPVLFSAPMVRALLEGRKTQTRRIVTSQWSNLKMRHELGERCLLWMRETIERAQEWGGIGYPADGTWFPNSAWIWKRDAIPSLHMPRWASRLTLEVTDVRIQRLQDISEQDAIAEGATSKPKVCGWGSQYDGWSMDWPAKEPERGWGDVCLGSARSAFGNFVNQLHGGKNWNRRPEPSFWDKNPEVVAISFKVHRCNIDDFSESAT